MYLFFCFYFLFSLSFFGFLLHVVDKADFYGSFEWIFLIVSMVSWQWQTGTQIDNVNDGNDEGSDNTNTTGFQYKVLEYGTAIRVGIAGGGWGVEPPPQFMFTDAHFWVKIGLKFQYLCKISNISTSDPPVLLDQFQHWLQ